jgi:hypothetical protein
MPDSSSPGSVHRRRRWPSNDSLLSIAATLLSLCAVVTTVWQTSIMREQLRLSVWPRLRIDMRYRTDNQDNFFHFKLENQGVGPAIISSLQFSYKGEKVGGMQEVWRRMLADTGVRPEKVRSVETNSVHVGQILAPQSTVVLLLPRYGDPPTSEIFDRTRGNIRVVLRYTSIYGEVWETGYPDTSSHRVGWAKDLP